MINNTDTLLNGGCNVFAYTLSKHINAKIAVITEKRAIVTQEGIRVKEGLIHAFCIHKDTIDADTVCYDASGKKTYSQILKDYNVQTPYFVIDHNVEVLYDPEKVLEYGYELDYETLTNMSLNLIEAYTHSGEYE